MTPFTRTSSTETLVPIPTTSNPDTILLAHHCPSCGRLHLQPHASPHKPLPAPPTMPCVAHTLDTDTGTENATCQFERLTHVGDIDIRDGKVSVGDEKIIKEICWGKGNRLCEKKACGKVQANHWRWKCEGDGGGCEVEGKGEMARGGATAGKTNRRVEAGEVAVLVGACLAVGWAVVSVSGI